MNGKSSDQSHELPRQWFNRVSRWVLSVILLFLMLGMLIGAGKLFLGLGGLLSTTAVTASYYTIISDVLGLFILMELSRSLVDYFQMERLRLTFIADAAIVFVLREIMIGLFEHKLSIPDIYALSTLLLVLGALRTVAALTYQKERALLAESTADNKPRL